jgi:hypothetical protein
LYIKTLYISQFHPVKFLPLFKKTSQAFAKSTTVKLKEGGEGKGRDRRKERRNGVCHAISE